MPLPVELSLKGQVLVNGLIFHIHLHLPSLVIFFDTYAVLKTLNRLVIVRGIFQSILGKSMPIVCSVLRAKSHFIVQVCDDFLTRIFIEGRQTNAMLVRVVASKDEIWRQTIISFIVKFICLTIAEIIAVISLKQLEINLPLVFRLLFGNLRLIVQHPLRPARLNRHLCEQFESEFFLLPLDCFPLFSLDVSLER